jgi:hypothetical protein
MTTLLGRLSAFTLVVALAGCAPTSSGTETAASVEPSVAPVASASPSEPPAAFPTAAFADISEDPVSEKVAAEYQAALNDMAGGAGMSATVMTADGTWSGATGKAIFGILYGSHYLAVASKRSADEAMASLVLKARAARAGVVPADVETI